MALDKVKEIVEQQIRLTLTLHKSFRHHTTITTGHNWIYLEMCARKEECGHRKHACEHCRIITQTVFSKRGTIYNFNDMAIFYAYCTCSVPLANLRAYMYRHVHIFISHLLGLMYIDSCTTSEMLSIVGERTQW